MMKKFDIPMMELQRFDAEDTIATSGCNVEALHCTDDCYCVAVDCENTYCESKQCDEDCYTDG